MQFNNILIIQTAFIGDAILTLPLIQVLKDNFTQASIDVVVVPRTAEIFTNHPSISQIIQYDKRKRDKGIRGFLQIRKYLNKRKYDLIVVPHRSWRSALLAKILKPALSIGFDRSGGRSLFHMLAHYNPLDHEIERNLALLKPLGIEPTSKVLPKLYPTEQDMRLVDLMLNDLGVGNEKQKIAIAPGTIWNTKRWPADRFAEVCRQLSVEHYTLLLIGGKEDITLCEEIKTIAKVPSILNVAGKLSIIQSAELIRRCKVLISNDSAPMHLAVAIGTPVVAIFGATVPEFGFAPRGPDDRVIETKGLTCRPCSIHGGEKCPIKTFDCMISITPQIVVTEALSILSKKSTMPK